MNIPTPNNDPLNKKKFQNNNNTYMSLPHTQKNNE